MCGQSVRVSVCVCVSVESSGHNDFGASSSSSSSSYGYKEQAKYALTKYRFVLLLFIPPVSLSPTAAIFSIKWNKHVFVQSRATALKANILK